MVKKRVKTRSKTRAKKRIIKRSAKKRVSAKRPKAVLKKPQGEKLEKIGEVTHYFPKVKAAAVLILKNSLKIGDGIYIKGHTTDFKEKVASMQMDHVSVQEGKKGDEIGLLVKSRVRLGDSVYRI